MKFSTIFFFGSTSADHYSEDYYKFSNEYIAIIGLNHLEKVSSEIFSIFFMLRGNLLCTVKKINSERFYKIKLGHLQLMFS